MRVDEARLGDFSPGDAVDEVDLQVGEGLSSCSPVSLMLRANGSLEIGTYAVKMIVASRRHGGNVFQSLASRIIQREFFKADLRTLILLYQS